MVEYFDRSAWTNHGPIRPLAPLDPAKVVGVSIHWPGSAGQWGPAPTLQQSAARLEAERVQHTSPSSSDPTKPWSDIAYNFAADLAGRTFVLRGVNYRSAANGSRAVNDQYVAITVLMAEDDTLTPAAVDAVRALRNHVLLRYPKATKVVGHRDLYSTDCPGDDLYALIKAGTLAGPPPGKDPDPMAGFTLDQLTRAISTKTMSADADFQPHDPTPADPERTIGPAAALGEILASCRRTEVDNARIESKLDKLLAATAK